MNMTAKELFGVGVRLVGIAAALVYLPLLIQQDYHGAMPGVLGLIVLTRANLIAQFCYPVNLRERALKDFQDS